MDTKLKNKKLDSFNYYYECKRCFYKSVIPSEIKRHLERQTKCKPHKDYIFLTEEDLLNQSLIKIFKNSEKIKEEYLIRKNNNQIIINENNDKKNNNICDFCQKNYKTAQSLEIHLKSCKSKYIIENVKNTKKINDNQHVINQNITNNIENNITNIENIQNNYQINIIINNNENDKEIKKLPFYYGRFDISHIDIIKQFTLYSENKLNNTLDEVFKNNSNKNFYIDDKQSLIYIGEDCTYKIDKKEIVKEIKSKLSILDQEFLDNLKKKYQIDFNKNFEEYCEKYIEDKNKEIDDIDINDFVEILKKYCEEPEFKKVLETYIAIEENKIKEIENEKKIQQSELTKAKNISDWLKKMTSK